MLFQCCFGDVAQATFLASVEGRFRFYFKSHGVVVGHDIKQRCVSARDCVVDPGDRQSGGTGYLVVMSSITFFTGFSPAELMDQLHFLC